MLRILFWAALAALFAWLFVSSVQPMTNPSIPLYVALGALCTYGAMVVLAAVHVITLTIRLGVRGVLLRPLAPVEGEGERGRVAQLAQRRIRLVR
jgi:hypothetical protein